MTDAFKIAAISGSLRNSSYNTATLRALKELAPAELSIDVLTLQDIEPFNEDVERKGWPRGVQSLREEVEPADGVLIATPEYNYSIPGVLKNALDWLSRPTGKGPIVGKPVALVGASQSTIGTARAQAHLRQVLFYNAMPLLPSAEVLIGGAADKFDDEGALTDKETEKFLKDMLTEFTGWIGRRRSTTHKET